MKTGIRREFDLVVKEKCVEGKDIIWSLTDHKGRNYTWKTRSSRNLEIGRAYVLKAKITIQQGIGWVISNPHFV